MVPFVLSHVCTKYVTTYHCKIKQSMQRLFLPFWLSYSFVPLSSRHANGNNLQFAVLQVILFASKGCILVLHS